MVNPQEVRLALGLESRCNMNNHKVMVNPQEI